MSTTYVTDQTSTVSVTTSSVSVEPRVIVKIDEREIILTENQARDLLRQLNNLFPQTIPPYVTTLKFETTSDK